MTRQLSVLALFVLGACTSIDQTEHCIQTRYGKIINDKLDNGLQATPFSNVTCFTLRDQNFPNPAEHASDKETMEAQTKDPLTITGDVAIVYAFDPTKIRQIYLEKRSQEQAELQILNAIRDTTRY